MIASELMTPNPRTMRPNDTISQAVDVLQTMNIRHLPVVDERSELIGMLSDRDLGSLMRILIDGVSGEQSVLPLSERRVSEVMSDAVVAVGLDTDVSQVITLMLEERIGAVPVVDDADHVQGIISYVDVLRALVE